LQAEGKDLGTDHFARNGQFDAAVLLTASEVSFDATGRRGAGDAIPRLRDFSKRLRGLIHRGERRFW